MCRSIRPLHGLEPPPTPEEVREAALQYVRKVSGSSRPARDNAEAVERAAREVAEATQRMLDALVRHGPPKDREAQAAKARARAQARYGAAAGPSRTAD